MGYLSLFPRNKSCRKARGRGGANKLSSFIPSAEENECLYLIGGLAQWVCHLISPPQSSKRAGKRVRCKGANLSLQFDWEEYCSYLQQISLGTVVIELWPCVQKKVVFDSWGLKRWYWSQLGDTNVFRILI